MPWNNVPKPTESSITSTVFGDGTPIGLLIALTQAQTTIVSSIITGWGDVPKATSSIWTLVSKPTS